MGVALIDERANEAQRRAIGELLSGQAGPPWAIIRATLTQVEDPLFVRYEVTLKGIHSVVRAGQHVELEMTPARNPVTGAEAHPRILLPEGMIWKEGEVAKSKVFRVRNGISYDHTGQYAVVAPFEYRGPAGG